ncbi:hypothetical protein JOC86_003023 [Bacillus pakistanensis]|uniref:Uncharacterized protein n=1 Tax=Rossellomorea pakistanensis TaxID=992288 RepID=A0ABS2NF36_9BACI|nr:hypothetical protein [Bacillus pakistanensis]MBM7586471.1 hypothetical protein [Bacillus pakistanensis]
MCDFADACYFCGKNVTTKEHVPTLTKKYETKLELIKDSEERGWEKEIACHNRMAECVKEILVM